MNLLEKEYDGLTDMLKTTIGQFLSWFTFFTGVNLIGYGWFASQLAANKGVARWVILIVCIYFLFQHALAYHGTNLIIRLFESTRERMQLLLDEMHRIDPPPRPAHIASPISAYIATLGLLRHTFVSMAILWIAFTAYAFLPGRS
jgi:hypothetical protein